VLINGAFFPLRSGCGGKATGSSLGAGTGSGASAAGVAAATSFAMRFALFGNPPVERGFLTGEIELVRDGASEVSVCAGEMSLERGSGGLSTGWTASGMGSIVCGLSAAFSTVCFFALFETGAFAFTGSGAGTSSSSLSLCWAFGFSFITLLAIGFVTGGFVAGKGCGRLVSAGEDGIRSCWSMKP
jgi:hypothetical protein